MRPASSPSRRRRSKATTSDAVAWQAASLSVTERSDLRFEFDRGDELSFDDDEEVPLFRRAKEARKLDVSAPPFFLSDNAYVGATGLNPEFDDEACKAIELSPTRDGASIAAITLNSRSTLRPRLSL